MIIFHAAPKKPINNEEISTLFANIIYVLNKAKKQLRK